MAALITDVEFDRLLKGALESHVQAETEKAITAGKEQLEQALRKSLASLTMSLMKHYSVQFGEREIIITVKNGAKL